MDLYQVFAGMISWEGLAVVLAIAYLLLAMAQNSLCWYCAFASTLIYTILFFNVSLLMESALNVFYMAMAVYGWWQWKCGGEDHGGVHIQCWPPAIHLAVFAGIALMSVVSGYLLESRTSAALPYLDSFTTWGAVVTTYMVAKKVLENWLYWILIDSVSIYLYLSRGMELTALLFAGYVVLAAVGYIAWRRQASTEAALA